MKQPHEYTQRNILEFMDHHIIDDKELESKTGFTHEGVKKQLRKKAKTVFFEPSRLDYIVRDFCLLYKEVYK